MFWFLAIIGVIVVVVATILFLNRFYRKGTREVALVRTGAGGQRVVMDGGCLALPILHRISEVNMKTTRIEIERTGEKSIITEDKLRVDAVAEVHVRVQPTEKGVATAAQALAGKSFRAAELAETIEGKVVDAMLSVGARYTMDGLHEGRGAYVREVAELVKDNLAQNGLVLESISLTRLDQTPFHALDENNAFNAVGMRRLAEVIAANKKQRAAIEADAEVAVRQSQLEATKRGLVIDQEEEEAQIDQKLSIESRRAQSQADIAERQAHSEERSEQARILREREVRALEIERDRQIRKLEMEASLATETAKHNKEIELATKRAEDFRAQAEAERARADQIAAQQTVESARDRAVAEREKEVALIRATEQAAVDDTRVKSEVGTIREMALAESEARNMRSKAMRDELLAESEGKAALIKAENSQRDELIRMKLDMHRLDTLPDVVREMVKPAEKIDSIRINHITGFGTGFGGPGGADSGGGGNQPVVNQVIDGILSMALQLPAARKLGEEIGINIGDGLAGLSDAVGETASNAADDGEGGDDDPKRPG